VRALGVALHVRQRARRAVEELLLLLAVWAPVGAVHHRARRREMAGEGRLVRRRRRGGAGEHGHRGEHGHHRGPADPRDDSRALRPIQARPREGWAAARARGTRTQRLSTSANTSSMMTAEARQYGQAAGSWKKDTTVRYAENATPAADATRARSQRPGVKPRSARPAI